MRRMENHRALIWTIRGAGAIMALYFGVAAIFGLGGALVSVYMAFKHGWWISLILLCASSFLMALGVTIGYVGYRMAFHLDRAALENFAFFFGALTAIGLYRFLVHGLHIGTWLYIPGIAFAPLHVEFGHSTLSVVLDEGSVAFLAFGLFFLLYWLVKGYLLRLFFPGKRSLA